VSIAALLFVVAGCASRFSGNSASPNAAGVLTDGSSIVVSVRLIDPERISVLATVNDGEAGCAQNLRGHVNGGGTNSLDIRLEYDSTVPRDQTWKRCKGSRDAILS